MRPRGSARTTTHLRGRPAKSVPSITGPAALASTISTALIQATRANSSQSSSRITTACLVQPTRSITYPTTSRTTPSPGYNERRRSTRPFFLYVAPSATHSPHMAPKEWIDKFKGQFDMGWDRYREMTLERQKELGVVPADTKLTARPASLPAWDSLNADQKRLYSRMMEVFAGFGAQIDYEMGRVLDAVATLPDADNTLVIYILGDNGASAEGGLDGAVNEIAGFNGVFESIEALLKAIDELGGPKHYNHFPAGWAWAMDTPFQWTKQIASHFGGTRNPVVVSWPVRIKDKGGLRSQFLHVIDIVPTIYEVVGITPPAELNGIPQKPIEGISFAYTFDDAQAKGRRTTQYFEMGVN